MQKLNFRHSLKTMNKTLSAHNEKVFCYWQAGKTVFKIKESDIETGKITKTCGVYYSANDCVNYINARNGF